MGSLCDICPRECKVNREESLGNCKAANKIKIALVSLHHFEEPCISGKNGSGTIFFSNCTLHCIYCQNYEISQLGRGRNVTVEELADIFIEHQEKGAENINLVTPTSYTLEIIEAIKIAKNKGLKIPIVYNTNGYEKVETLKKLEGYVDIYLPDFKYMEDELGETYSFVNNYSSVAKDAIKEMYRQVGAPVFNEKGMIKKGMIIRHLILPNHIENSKKVLKWIKENIDPNVYVSIMAQYFPTYKAKDNEMLNRKLSENEYQSVIEYVEELNFENGYIQDLGDHEEEYVPKWEW